MQKQTPLVGSITNTVTQEFVANAQLAYGGSAAMVYMPDEACELIDASAALYINVGTMIPILEKTIPQAMDHVYTMHKPWVLDPVGIGMGSIRTHILRDARRYHPTIIRCNASEAIALAHLWDLDVGQQVSHGAGVDSHDTTQMARTAAISLARCTGGAVAVSGDVDIVTDGICIAEFQGGSPMMERITGFGCSLGGVCAVCAGIQGITPFEAASAAVYAFKCAGSYAQRECGDRGPGSFKQSFLDALYHQWQHDVDASTISFFAYGLNKMAILHKKAGHEMAHHTSETKCQTSSPRDRVRACISKYLVIGKENTKGRPVEDIVFDAVRAGFTCVQIRSKKSTDRQIIEEIACAAHAIDRVCALPDDAPSIRPLLLVDDRPDIAYASRDLGIHIDGVHVGQDDIPAHVCRDMLGEDAVVGLSLPLVHAAAYLKHHDIQDADYLGVSPFHLTSTKPESGHMADGSVHTQTTEDLTKLAKISPLPVVVGGGVQVSDIPAIAHTGIDGFFVVSAICAAPDPYAAAQELCHTWDIYKK